MISKIKIQSIKIFRAAAWRAIGIDSLMTESQEFKTVIRLLVNIGISVRGTRTLTRLFNKMCVILFCLISVIIYCWWCCFANHDWDATFLWCCYVCLEWDSVFHWRCFVSIEIPCFTSAVLSRLRFRVSLALFCPFWLRFHTSMMLFCFFEFKWYAKLLFLLSGFRFYNLLLSCLSRLRFHALMI